MNKLFDKTGREITEEQVKVDITSISRFSAKNERLAWNRKKKRMETFIEELEPLSQQMLELIQKKQPILDKVDKLRTTMVKECIHPHNYLVHRGVYVLCKFCRNKLNLNSD